MESIVVDLLYLVTIFFVYIFLKELLPGKTRGMAALFAGSLVFLPLIQSEILLVLAIVFLTMYLFFKEIFPADVTALFTMVLLMVLRLVTPEEGISGFSNDAVVTILAMFILSAGIEKTGLIRSLSLRVFGWVGSNEILQLVVVMAFVAAFSGFINNAAVVAILLPFVLKITRMSKTSSSKLLIPLSFVSMSAGMLTLIGTSTNLIANSILSRYSAEGIVVADIPLVPFRMFDFWEIGLIVLVVTALYFLLIGYWILPRRKGINTDSPHDDLTYSCEVRIVENSKLVGKKIKDSIFRKRYRARIVSLKRGDKIWKEDFSDRVLVQGDLVTLETTRDNLLSLESESGIAIYKRKKNLTKKYEDALHVMIPIESRYIKKKLHDLHLNRGYRSAIMAIRRGSEKFTEGIEHVKLQLGDMLLVKSDPSVTQRIKNDPNLLFLGEMEGGHKRDKQIIAVLIMIAVVTVAALGIYPILVTSLVGVILMFATGILSPGDAYKSVRWDVIFLLAGLIPLGIAFENTGASSQIARLIGSSTSGLPLLWIMVGFYIFTTLMTEMLSNNASVILLMPIVLDLSAQLGVSPYPLILVVMFAASTSFLTPIGYKTNTMVYGTGVYRFSDFFRVGVLLNLFLAVITPVVILQFFGP